MKIKRFEEAEAVVLDTYEGMSNLNKAQRDALGRTKRSSAQAGKVGRGELGGFVVSALDSKVVCEHPLAVRQVHLEQATAHRLVREPELDVAAEVPQQRGVALATSKRAR